MLDFWLRFCCDGIIILSPPRKYEVLAGRCWHMFYFTHCTELHYKMTIFYECFVWSYWWPRYMSYMERLSVPQIALKYTQAPKESNLNCSSTTHCKKRQQWSVMAVAGIKIGSIGRVAADNSGNKGAFQQGRKWWSCPAASSDDAVAAIPIICQRAFRPSTVSLKQ